MVIETLLASLGGGIARMVPEILNWMDRKDLRKHELSMQDKAFKFEELRGSQRMDEVKVEGQMVLDKGGLEALITSIKTQGEPTGVGLIDAINSLVRPFLTFWWCVVLVTVAMACQVVQAWESMSFAQAFLSIWGPDEKAIVSGIMTFWFLDRVIRKNTGN